MENQNAPLCTNGMQCTAGCPCAGKDGICHCPSKMRMQRALRSSKIKVTKKAMAKAIAFFILIYQTLSKYSYLPVEPVGVRHEQ